MFEAVVTQLEKSLSVEFLLVPVDYHRMLFDLSTGISVRSHWKKLKKCVENTQKSSENWCEGSK